jgi:hypothetical protein
VDEFDADEEEDEEDEEDKEMGADDEDQDEVNSLNIQRLVQVCVLDLNKIYIYRSSCHPLIFISYAHHVNFI